MDTIIWHKRTYSSDYSSGLPRIKSTINNQSVISIIIKQFFNWWCKKIKAN